MAANATISTETAAFAFGSYGWICGRAALVVCPKLGSTGLGIEPVCYARNVEIGNTLIFQPAASFTHICALVMVAIMVFHIRSKYTAVGRKEIVLFFYLYAVVELLSIFLDSGIIPASSSVYSWFAAIHTGFVTATYWCLLVNGFVGFQFAEDGTPRSLWSLRLSCLFVFLLSGFFAIATFNGIASFSPAKPTVLWIVQFVFNGACVVIYTVLQLVLVLRTLEDRWPIGDILFGIGFFVCGLVVQYGFSNQICDAVKHYIDGMFFATVCILLSVMMVYKYWDSITTEDLEFSVGSKQAVWEVKESLLRGDDLDDGGYTSDNAGQRLNVGPAPHHREGYGQIGTGAGYPPVPTKYGNF